MLREKRDLALKIENEIRERIADIPGARFQLGPQDNGVKMQIVLQSEDQAALTAAARAW